MAEQTWYYARSGQQAGPVTLAALQGLVRSGEVSPSDLVWSEGMADWHPASAVAALSSHIAAVDSDAGEYGLAPDPVPHQTAPAHPYAQAPAAGGYAAPMSGYPQQQVYAPPGV